MNYLAFTLVGKVDTYTDIKNHFFLFDINNQNESLDFYISQGSKQIYKHKFRLFQGRYGIQPNNKSKLKAHADDKINSAENLRFVL